MINSVLYPEQTCVQVARSQRTSIHPQVEQNSTKPQKDTVTISEQGQALLRSQTRMSCTEEVFEYSNIDFSCTAAESSSISVTGTGLTISGSSALYMNLEMTLLRKNADDSYQAFNMEISMSFRKEQSLTINPETKKEELTGFVNRVVRSIVKTVQDKGKDFAGILFDSDDYKDLSAIDNGKFVRKLESLLQVIITQTRLNHLLKEEKPGVQVIFCPQRKEENSISADGSSCKKMDIHIDVFESELNCDEKKDEDDEKSEGHIKNNAKRS